MPTKTEKTKRTYDRYSMFYDMIEYPFEKLVFGRWRDKMLSGLRGRVLEIGVGTGQNLRYYPDGAEVTGIDISKGMLQKAVKVAGLLDREYRLIQMDAQKLQFKDNSFDAVICTFVMCSVPNPVEALKEIRRVVKTDGKIILLEHVLSKNRMIALFQHLHNPITSFLLGFNVNRNTRLNIADAGLDLVRDDKLLFHDVFRRFECSGR